MAGTKREVLILDERTDTLMDLFDLVSREGFETIGVSSEKEALSCIARRRPDVLIEHLRNSTSAREVKLLEKAREFSPRMRIILLSESSPDSIGAGRVLPEGEVVWIPEPLQESSLLEALDRAVQAVAAQ